MVVMNGNDALGMGIMASGMEVCAMYPIIPATSVSHFLAAAFNQVGGFVHQAEDEIAAIGFALGASFAGKTAVTITSGPGLALKTEFIKLAVMAEIPLLIVVVQRGGPSTGLPTKIEQGDLLVVGWGSTLGTIEEAVDNLRRQGGSVSSLHLRFLSPLEPGLKGIFQRFKRVMTVEINYSDDPEDPFIDCESRRYAQLAQLLRAHTLVDVDCWWRVPGSPLPPADIEAELKKRLNLMP